MSGMLGAQPTALVWMDVHQLFAASLAHHRQGRLSEAEIGYRKVLAAAPEHTDSLHLLGVVATQSGRHQEAVGLIGRAIGLRSAPVAEFHSNIGLAYRGLGQNAEAIRHFGKAVSLKPDYVDAHINLGAVLLDEGRPDEAETHCRRAVGLKPGSANARFALGAALQRLRRLDEATLSYREAVRLRPAYAEAWCNLGAVLHRRRAFDDASAALREAVRLRPDYAHAYYNLGAVLQDQGRTAEALACYRQAQSLKPGYAEAHWNEALLCLTIGEFAEGWAKYEWRWRLRDHPPRAVKEPPWDGARLDGRAILLHAEQGIGDTIQFARYAALVKNRGASTVVLDCPPGLARLLERAPGIDRVASLAADALVTCDYHAPLPSLPGIFATTLRTIPADIPYLTAIPGQIAGWRQRLGREPRLKVGLAWRGAAGNTRDATRSIPASAMALLCGVPGIDWVCLQIDARKDELDSVSGHGVIHDFGPELTDWADTAALVTVLDLIVTVDTAVAHLAGALGKPVWVLLAFVAHWCWLTGRSDNPWYPTARLFRQSAQDDWSGVLSEVRKALTRQVQGNRSAAEAAASLQS